MIMEEELIAIPKSEYEFLLHCKQELIRLHEEAILKCRHEMQGQQINGIIQTSL